LSVRLSRLVIAKRSEEPAFLPGEQQVPRAKNKALGMTTHFLVTTLSF